MFVLLLINTYLKMKNYTLEGINKNFENLGDLINFVLESGICPSIKVLIDGKETGETAGDFLVE